METENSYSCFANYYLTSTCALEDVKLLVRNDKIDILAINLKGVTKIILDDKTNKIIGIADNFEKLKTKPIAKNYRDGLHYLASFLDGIIISLA